MNKGGQPTSGTHIESTSSSDHGTLVDSDESDEAASHTSIVDDAIYPSYDDSIPDYNTDNTDVLSAFSGIGGWNDIPVDANNSGLSSRANDTVNPWNVEYRPNPVIFSHYDDWNDPKRSEEASHVATYALGDFSYLEAECISTLTQGVQAW